MEKWPNFFIVGAMRAGTTSLYEYLRCQPRVFMPSRKESNYFTKSDDPNFVKLTAPVRSKNEYLDLFKKAKDEVAIGEACISYLSDPEAPKLIHDVVPDAKIIIILRNPIERTLSDYLYGIRMAIENLTFSDALKRDLSRLHLPYRSIIKGSFYSQKVKRYIDTFGHEQIKIIIFEEFVQNPKRTVKETLEFLGIKGEFSEFEVKAHNDSRMPRGQLEKALIHSSAIRGIAVKMLPNSVILSLSEKFLYKKDDKPQILPEERKALQEIFFGDVLILQDILGRSLPWL